MILEEVITDSGKSTEPCPALVGRLTPFVASFLNSFRASRKTTSSFRESAMLLSFPAIRRALNSSETNTNTTQVLSREASGRWARKSDAKRLKREDQLDSVSPYASPTVRNTELK